MHSLKYIGRYSVNNFTYSLYKSVFRMHFCTTSSNNNNNPGKYETKFSSELPTINNRLPPKENPVPDMVRKAPIENHFKLLVLGGGTGGISIASIFSRYLKAPHQVAIIEPSIVHYYQPMWTFVGAGIEPFDKTVRKTADLIPPKTVWFQDRVVKIEPQFNTVQIQSGQQIGYDFMVVALGLKLDLDKIPGLVEGLNNPESGVVCNYSPNTVRNTFPTIERLKAGNALFTFPDTPVKCAGAAQKIMYLAEEYTRKHNVRQNIDFHYMTPADAIFMVPKYSKALHEICRDRGINFHPYMKLIELDVPNHLAKFAKCKPLGPPAPSMPPIPIVKEAEKPTDNRSKNGDPPAVQTFKYSMIHVTPPMCAPDVLRNSPLCDGDPYGYMKIDKFYLHSLKYPNVYGLGDCTDAPKSKTAAALAGELKTVRKNLKLSMEGKSPIYRANGYSSCPLTVNSNKVMLAEFDYDKKPLETFPVNQAVPRRTMLWLKKYFMPFMYWHLFLKGRWEGPSFFRKLWRLGMS